MDQGTSAVCAAVVAVVIVHCAWRHSSDDVKLFIRLLCGSRQPRIDVDSHISTAIVTGAQNKGIEVFAGFREVTYRLVFECQDAGVEKKMVETILPDGNVEMDKEFQPRKGRGLMTFGYSQTIDRKDAKRHVMSPQPTPFIDSDNLPDNPARLALVQTWTVNVNKSFRDEFDIFQFDERNFQGRIHEGFHRDAVDAFRKAMVKCFGSAVVEKWPIMCCKKEKNNPHLVFVGPRSVMEAWLKKKDVQEYLFISEKNNGFKTWFKSKGSWLPRSQRFAFSNMNMDDKCVLYTRASGSLMTSMMTCSQFEKEKTFGAQRTPAK